MRNRTRIKRRHPVLIALAGLSFLFSLLLGVLGPELIPTTSYEEDSYSYSSAGFRAYVEVLEELGVPVTVSTWASGRRAGQGGVLLLFAPHGRIRDTGVLRDEFGKRTTVRDHMVKLVNEAEVTILVLPKWRVVESPTRDGWADHVKPVAIEWVTQNLNTLGLATNGLMRLGDDDMGSEWETGGLGPLPRIPGCQLLAPHPAIDPIVDCDRGTLVGETRGPRGGRLLIVADPDLANTQALASPGNMTLMTRLIEHVRRDGSVIVDEVLHGYGRRPSFWGHALRMPFVLIPLQALLLLATLLWAGADRFGLPVREPVNFAPGHRDLVRNTASLMHASGKAQGPATLRHYFTGRVSRLRHHFALVDPMSEETLARRLDTIAHARGASTSYTTLRDAMQELEKSRFTGAFATLDLAARMHAWTQEMLDGSSNRS